MPPRRGNLSNANVTPPFPEQEISNAKFRNAIQILAHSVANQNNRIQAYGNGESTTTRYRDFCRINHLEFIGSQTSEDPQNFLDDITKIFEVMQVSGNDQVEFVSYQLKDVSHIWYTHWKENRVKDAAPITWHCFSETFSEKIFLIDLREAKPKEFMNLRQGNMMVQEYELNFNQFSMYAPHMIAYSKTHMNNFLYGVSDLVKSECINPMLLGDMNMSRLMTNAQKVEGDKHRKQDKDNKKSRT